MAREKIDEITIGCRFLDQASSYERTVTGWVDTLMIGVKLDADWAGGVRTRL